MITDIEEILDEVSEYETGDDVNEDQREALAEIVNDPLLFIETVLKIKDKLGHLVDFEFNQPQLRLYNEFRRQQKEKRPVRIIILKARQMGFSTAVAGLFYHATVTNFNTDSAIVAHKAEASTNIFDKAKLFFENSPNIFRPQRKASNAKELVFENPSTNTRVKSISPGLRSRIRVETAVDKNVLRSATIQYLHLSELAFWPYPEESMASAMQAVPPQPGTAVIIESTANGIGGTFYDEWMRAERGESEFVPLFFPWYEMDEYRMPVPDDFSLTDDERDLKELYGLDDEQLVWRRWCISANCKGSIDTFHQEYPSTPHEAFLSSGRPVFDSKIVDKAIMEAKDPVKQGRVVKANPKAFPKFRTEFRGQLKVWEEPQDGANYVIGIDSASGEQNGDYSCMSVFRLKDKVQVAEWWGHMPPYVLGEEAEALGTYYNRALLVPEANNHGVSVIDALRKLHYNRIFRRRATPDNKKDHGSSTKIGWWTSETSKKLLINNLREFVREDVSRIKSKEALKEMMTYVYDDHDRSAAQNGCYDDRVIATALAVYGCKVYPDNKPFVDSNIISLYGNDSITGY